MSWSLTVAPAKALSNLHAKAWGKPWPHKSRCTITKGEIVNDETGLADEDDLDLKDGPLRDILHIPASCQYDCFNEMQSFTDAFEAAATVRNVLVVRKEYEILREALEEKEKEEEEKKKRKEGHRDQLSVVVTGQPGIGSYETLVHV